MTSFRNRASKKQIMIKSLTLILTLTINFFLYFPKAANAQYEDGSSLEFSAGMKTVIGDISYGRTFYGNTTSGGFALQPSLRADLNLFLFSLHDEEWRINIVGQTGIYRYFKANKFDYTAVEPFTGDTVHYRSKNPTYLPLYFGFYSPYSFMIGFEMFYYKGIGAEDLYGFKLISIGYNARKFRVGAAFEMYDQVRQRNNTTTDHFLSFEFHWKLNRKEDY